MDYNISPENLKKLLSYSPETGIITWKYRDLSFFKNESYQNKWNDQFSGRPALSWDDGKGYKVGNILGKTYRSHRVAWAIYHGKWPENQIDHINGNKGDNRIVNLRDVRAADNLSNRVFNRNKKIGIFPSGIGWKAHACVCGKMLYLGTFQEKETAMAVRGAASKILNEIDKKKRRNLIDSYSYNRQRQGGRTT